MDPFSYIASFIVLIPALALTRVLGGTADLVQHGASETPGRVAWSGLFVLAVVGFVLAIAHQWWILYNWRDQGPYGFWTFCFLLIRPALLLFATRLLIPDVKPGADVDLDAHYFTVARWVYPLVAMNILLDLPDTLLKGGDRLAELGGGGYVLAIVVWAALYGSMGIVRTRRYHWVFGALLYGGFALSLILFGTEGLG